MKKELIKTLSDYVSKRENDLKPTAMNFFFTYVNKSLTKEIINICRAAIKILNTLEESSDMKIAPALGNTLDAAIRLVQAARVKHGQFKVWEQGPGQIHYDGPPSRVVISRGLFEDSIEKILENYPIKPTVGTDTFNSAGRILNSFESDSSYQYLDREQILKTVIGDVSASSQPQYTNPTVKKIEDIVKTINLSGPFDISPSLLPKAK